MMSYHSPLSTDDVDGVLRAFFKAQMPAPWPSLKVPPIVAKTAKGWPMMRSRLALAASVGLLALGLSSLAGAFHGRNVPSEQRIRVDSPSASAENDPLHRSVQPPLKVKAKAIDAP
jgi:hypothetical protein